MTWPREKGETPAGGANNRFSGRPQSNKQKIMKKIKTKLSVGSLARAALVAAVLLSPHVASAAGVTTTYSNAELFIGFRQSGVANTLAVNIGAATQYIPTNISNLGTAAPGGQFNVSFGTVPVGTPGAGDAVTNLDADLTAVFGGGWATNNQANSSLDVSWAIAGTTSTTSNSSPIAGLTKRSIFLTVARTSPSTVASAPGDFDIDGSASPNINSFAQGVGAGSYKGRTSTINSNKAYIGAASDGNNWGTQAGTAGSTFGVGFNAEQPLSGANSGPTDSVLDLYLFPNTLSGTPTFATDPTYLGSFSLSSGGVLSYTAVPEPSTFALVAITGTVFTVFLRRRNRLNL